MIADILVFMRIQIKVAWKDQHIFFCGFKTLKCVFLEFYFFGPMTLLNSVDDIYKASKALFPLFGKLRHFNIREESAAAKPKNVKGNYARVLANEAN